MPAMITRLSSCTLRLAGAHGALAAAAFVASPAAGLAASVVAAIALLRYASIAAFTSTLGPGAAAKTALAVGGWVVAMAAMAAAIVATARLARAALPWAAAAALVGPVELMVEAIAGGLGGMAKAARTGGAS